MKDILRGALVLATHNKGKLAELRAALSPFVARLEDSLSLGLKEPEETGETFYDNALLKARAAACASGLPALADDSGLCVAALGGRPGVHSARYAGGDLPSAMRRLHEELGGAQDRSAFFICALVLAWPDGRSIAFEGRCDGVIVWPARGNGGHGYDPVFQPDGETRTFAEMPPEEKDDHSHRGRALKMLMAFLKVP